MEREKGWTFYLIPGNETTQEIVSESMFLDTMDRQWTLSDVKEKRDAALAEYDVTSYSISMTMKHGSRRVAVSDTALKHLKQGDHDIYFYLHQKPESLNSSNNSNNNSNGNNNCSTNSTNKTQQKTMSNKKKKKNGDYDWNKRIDRMFYYMRVFFFFLSNPLC